MDILDHLCADIDEDNSSELPSKPYSLEATKNTMDKGETPHDVIVSSELTRVDHNPYLLVFGSIFIYYIRRFIFKSGSFV